MEEQKRRNQKRGQRLNQVREHSQCEQSAWAPQCVEALSHSWAVAHLVDANYHLPIIRAWIISPLGHLGWSWLWPGITHSSYSPRKCKRQAVEQPAMETCHLCVPDTLCLDWTLDTRTFSKKAGLCTDELSVIPPICMTWYGSTEALLRHSGFLGQCWRLWTRRLSYAPGNMYFQKSRLATSLKAWMEPTALEPPLSSPPITHTHIHTQSKNLLLTLRKAWFYGWRGD